MGRVQDQVAIVTGAGKGLGEAISYRLAQEGARLVLADIDETMLEATAKKIRDDGGEVVLDILPSSPVRIREGR